MPSRLGCKNKPKIQYSFLEYVEMLWINHKKYKIYGKKRTNNR